MALQQGQGLLRGRVCLGQDGGSRLRQDLIARQVAGFLREVGIGDRRFGGRHVFVRDAQAVHRRPDGERLERAQTASETADLIDGVVQNGLSDGQIAAGEAVGAAAAERAEISIDGISEIAGGYRSDSDGGLVGFSNLGTEGEGRPAAGDVEGLRTRLVVLLGEVEADVEGGVAVADSQTRDVSGRAVDGDVGVGSELLVAGAEAGEGSRQRSWTLTNWVDPNSVELMRRSVPLTWADRPVEFLTPLMAVAIEEMVVQKRTTTGWSRCCRRSEGSRCCR